MQETTTELHSTFSPETNTTDLLERKLSSLPEQTLFRVQGTEGWSPVSARQFREEVAALARGLVAAGLQPGDRVGIICPTRYEWALVDFAILYAGCVTVPVYETSSPAQIAAILKDSGARGIVVEGRRHADAVRRATGREELALEHLWQIQGPAEEEHSLAALREAGEQVTEEQLQQARTAAGLEDTATIIYTSGTTGRPKGCPLTHANIVELCASARQAIPEVASPENSALLFLPMAHVFARYIHFLALDAGVVVGHTPDLKNLTADMKSFAPDFLLVVPRVFEKIFNGARNQAHEGSPAKGKVFDWAVKVAQDWSQATTNGSGASLALRAQHALAERLVYSTLRTAMGGRIKYSVSGGGPLAPRLAHFFHGAGILILEGYGLTETTAPATVGTVSDFQIGTVGPPLPGTSVRIAEDGEILLRGVGVIQHYYHNPEADAEAFTPDGWFRTGDLGELTEEGWLKITGRKKEVLVTAGGKNVIPARVEDAIRTSPLVSQCVVIGDQRPFVAALVTLDEETLPQELPKLGLPADLSAEEAGQRPEVQAAVQKLIDASNEDVSRAESVRAFRIIPDDFTEQSGHLTPSLKIKRPQVLKDYEAVIEEIYAGKKPEQG